jgi:hypothetical protein
MPLHDWTRVRSGLFHHFHQDWSVEIARALNLGKLPKPYSALVEQRTGGPEPDVVAIQLQSRKKQPTNSGPTLLAEQPKSRIVQQVQSDRMVYARKANQIVIRHDLGKVVAIMEIVSPGNKSSRSAMREFVTKSVQFLKAGVHLMVIDLFPPSPRDPFGLHKAIWDELQEEPFEIPKEHRACLVGYDAGDPITAYIETVGLGQPLPEMPLFLEPQEHILVPLEETYETAWRMTPEAIHELIEDPDSETLSDPE